MYLDRKYMVLLIKLNRLVCQNKTHIAYMPLKNFLIYKLPLKYSLIIKYSINPNNYQLKCIIIRHMTKNLLLLAVILLFGTVLTQPIQRPGDEPTPPENPPRNLAFRIIGAGTTQEILENQARISELNSRQIIAPVPIDLYSAAKYVFNLQYYFNYCDQCKRLEYIAFKVGRYYLTARPNQLRLQVASSPNNNQLFTAEQQVDGTWAFKSLTQNRYIRASNDGTTINYQSFVGAWERWYIERHNDHLHIQSAQFIYHWWVFNGLRLEQLFGGASALRIEYWPKLQWLWNW